MAAAPSVSFKHSMTAPSDPDDPWVSVEITEQGSRREYQEWPLDKAVIAFDGERVWSEGWKRLNPPKFMVNMAYYFVNLPWVTQDPGVNLIELGEGTLPNDDKTYATVRMTFDAGVGDASEDYYLLFIDKETGLLKGTEYIVTYGAMLDLMGAPEDATFLGPLTKVFDDHVDVAGLTVPTTYKTYAPNGMVYGEHTVENISFTRKFDPAIVEMPAGAVIDESSNERKKKS